MYPVNTGSRFLKSNSWFPFPLLVDTSCDALISGYLASQYSCWGQVISVQMFLFSAFIFGIVLSSRCRRHCPCVCPYSCVVYAWPSWRFSAVLVPVNCYFSFVWCIVTLSSSELYRNPPPTIPPPPPPRQKALVVLNIIIIIICLCVYDVQDD